MGPGYWASVVSFRVLSCVLTASASTPEVYRVQKGAGNKAKLWVALRMVLVGVDAITIRARKQDRWDVRTCRGSASSAWRGSDF